MTQQLDEKQRSLFITINSNFFINSIRFGIASSVRTIRLATTRNLIAILIFTSWTLTAPQANAQPAIEDIAAKSITIQALIDGKSQLHLKGNSAQWFHRDFAAPGRHHRGASQGLARVVGQHRPAELLRTRLRAQGGRGRLSLEWAEADRE